MTDNHNLGRHGVIIFDGSCGACSTFVGHKKSFYNRHGFEVVPLQEKWVRDLSGLSEEALHQAVHLYTKNGEVYKGIDFFEYFANKVWWLYPLALIFKIKLVKSIFGGLYNFIARKRYSISKICKLQSNAFYK